MDFAIRSGICRGLRWGNHRGDERKGLVINGLFCKGAVYDNDSTATRPPISMAMFVGWLLDMNATTAEVVEVLKAHNFSLGGATFDGGTVSALHWGVTDATGASVIFEFNNGDIHIYDMGRYHAMTNDPKWPDMQAIIDYWEGIGGRNMLPGSVSSPSRCVRGNYFANHVEKTADAALAVSITRSILVNVSVPYTYAVEGEPNLSSTQWRSYADTKNLRYHFEIVTNPGYYYVDLTKLDLNRGAPVLKLDTQKHTELVGCANSQLHRSAPFTPMY